MWLDSNLLFLVVLDLLASFEARNDVLELRNLLAVCIALGVVGDELDIFCILERVDRLHTREARNRVAVKREGGTKIQIERRADKTDGKRVQCAPRVCCSRQARC